MTYDVIVRNGLHSDGIDLPVFEEFGAAHPLAAEVAEWFGLPAGTLREGARADFVVIDPAGLDDSVDTYHEDRCPSTATCPAW